MREAQSVLSGLADARPEPRASAVLADLVRRRRPWPRARSARRSARRSSRPCGRPSSDEDAAAAVRSGCLTHGLSYSGLGPGRHLDGDRAPPARRPRRGVRRGAGRRRREPATGRDRGRATAPARRRSGRTRTGGTAPRARRELAEAESALRSSERAAAAAAGPRRAGAERAAGGGGGGGGARACVAGCPRGVRPGRRRRWRRRRTRPTRPRRLPRRPVRRSSASGPPRTGPEAAGAPLRRPWSRRAVPDCLAAYRRGYRHRRTAVEAATDDAAEGPCSRTAPPSHRHRRGGASPPGRGHRGSRVPRQPPVRGAAGRRHRGGLPRQLPDRQPGQRRAPRRPPRVPAGPLRRHRLRARAG